MPRKYHVSGYEISYPEMRRTRKSNDYNRKNNAVKNGFSLNPRSKRKIQNSVNYIFHSTVNKYLKWVTLSLPTSKSIENKKEIFQSDKYYTKKLSSFLSNLKKYHDIKSYIWVAERQTKNDRGAIHFHLILDVHERINIRKINDLWVNSLSDFHNYSPNALDIEIIKQHDSLKSYLVKYVQKNEMIMHCRVWGQSRNLTEVSNGIVIDDVRKHELFTDFAYPDENWIFIEKELSSDFKLQYCYRSLDQFEIAEFVEKFNNDNKIK